MLWYMVSPPPPLTPELAEEFAQLRIPDQQLNEGDDGELSSDIAAAISLGSYLLVVAFSKSQPTVQLSSRDIGLNHTWEIDALP